MNPYETEEYQKFVESMAAHCHCEPLSLRPCEGVLAGGLCDDAKESPRSEEQEDENTES
jgi:hypothetical protein